MTSDREQFVDVAIPLPVDDPFSYHVPLEKMSVPPKGSRVIVPFKNREIIGYVVGPSRSQEYVSKTKPLTQWLEGEILDEKLLALTKQISKYYCCSWGEAISNALPQLLKKATSKPRKKKQDSEDADAERVVDGETISDHALTTDQKESLAQIIEKLKARASHTYLLHGVTASGKTEVYVHAIRACLEEKRTAICLVPEIALTIQVRNYFRKRFGEEIVVVHSHMTPRERFNSWARIRKGEVKIVLGPRSAIFAPLENLGLIIIDEEQEDTYKQEESPRYHAVQVARWRTESEKAVLVLGSATPSIESSYSAEIGQIEKLELSERVTPHSLPDIEVVDIRSEKNPLCSRVLDRAIQETLSDKEGILLFLNRRGFSTQLRCTTCQDVATCRFCHVALTYHQEFGAAICHYCNFRWTKLAECPQCKAKTLKYLGIGSEKVESEFARRFPLARVARLDSDVARKRGKAEEILEAFRRHEIDILVGTQMIAKGHDFPRVTLVGVLQADLALALPDFRSSERNFQILVQVAGRAGRGEKKGRVVIQTYSPDHYSILAAARHDYATFYREEIESRKRGGYPPFSRLINVVVRGKQGGNVEKFILGLRLALDKYLSDSSLSLIGPAPCPIAKLRGHYRWHLLLKGPSIENLSHYLQQAIQQIKRSNQIYLAIDVDPVNIL